MTAAGSSTGSSRPPTPQKAGDTTRENPWAVRTMALKMSEYVAHAPAAWIEGQIAQLTAKSSSATAFMTLRDPSVDISMQVTCARSLLSALPTPPSEGGRVVVHGRFEFYAPRGSLGFRVDAIHPVGLGELLARLERLRRLLAAEGLTAPERKQALPFLPDTVGLITGRASAAESDVLVNARARWPAVQFRVENTVVQGSSAVPQLIDALERLDADPRVEVIVLARGGGSVEDLLPFSDETLCRAVSACRTPVVSAIGHEPDHPLVDDVADLRCSTPTDAGKRVVPDAAAEGRQVDLLRARGRRALVGWVTTQEAHLLRLRSATVLTAPLRGLAVRDAEIERLRERSTVTVRRLIDRVDRDLAHRRAQLSALGPAATLARGYAVVQAGTTVVRTVGQAPAGTVLRIRVADGVVLAGSDGPESERANHGQRASERANHESERASEPWAERASERTTGSERASHGR